MNDRDKIELESVLLDHALISVGLDFGGFSRAEKKAIKKAEKEASSNSIEENLNTKSEKHQHPIHNVSFDWFLSGLEWIIYLEFCY